MFKVIGDESYEINEDNNHKVRDQANLAEGVSGSIKL